MSFLAQLEWRHATKGFVPGKKVSDADLGKILHAIRMAPTSYGLQPFEVVVIQDQALQDKLLPHAYGQKQISTAAALLVFVARTDVLSRIDQLMTGLTGGNADARAGLKGYEAAMRGNAQTMTPADAKSWCGKQAYIAMAFGLAACAELKIDSCPMEGFSSPEFDKILGLPSGHFSVCLMPIGYRDPSTPPRDKFRFPEADLFKHRK